MTDEIGMYNILWVFVLLAVYYSISIILIVFHDWQQLHKSSFISKACSFEIVKIMHIHPLSRSGDTIQQTEKKYENRHTKIFCDTFIFPIMLEFWNWMQVT